MTQWLTGAGLSVTRSGPTTTSSRSRARPPRSRRVRHPARALLVNGMQSGRRRPTSPCRIRSRARLGGHRPHDVRPHGEAGRLRPARRIRQRNAVLSYYGEKTASGAPQFQRQDAAVRGLRLHAGPASRRVRRGPRSDRRNGETVAIIDAYDAPTLERRREHVLRSRTATGRSRRGQFQDQSVPEDASTGDDCGGNGWYGEQALDVEAVHAMAPRRTSSTTAARAATTTTCSRRSRRS